MKPLPLLEQFIQALQCLPGIGQKSAQRLALHLLDRDRKRGKQLAETLLLAMDNIHYCRQCRNYTAADLCQLCQNSHRDHQILCIVESALDIMAIEAAKSFSGSYFVLHGSISPLEGIGPEALGMPLLAELIQHNTVVEVILATNATIEGEATAHYIIDLVSQIKPTPKISRIAHGIPVGGELEMINSHTLSYALNDRKTILEQV